MSDNSQPVNPFDGLLTSQALEDKRKQELLAMSGNDPNRLGFAMNLFRVQQGLRDSGIGLTKDDMRAQRNDAILSNAGKDINAKVKDGQMNPQDAMQSTLESAFQAMLKSGDTESAAVLAPHIFAQRQQQAQLDLLKQQAAYTGNRSEVDAAKADAAAVRAQAAEERVKNQNDLDAARADLARRTDPNLRKTSNGTTTTNNTFSKFRSQGGSVVGLMNQLGDIYDVYNTTPGVASSPATIISALADQVKGAKELVAPDTKAYNYQLATKLSADNSKTIQGLAASLNTDRGLLESLVTDTAYTLARARDPSGRISNADYDNAIRLLGAAKDPNRAKAVILDLGRRTARDFKNQADANPDFANEPVIGQVDAAYTGLLDRAKGKTNPPPKTPKTPSAAPTSDVSKLSDKDLLKMLNGG